MLGRVFLNWPQTPIDLCLQQNCESIKCKKGCFNLSLTLLFLTSRLPSEGTQCETALRHLLLTGAWRLLITETPWVLCSLFHSITLSGTRQQITRPSILTRMSHLAIPDASRVLRSLFHLSHAMKSFTAHLCHNVRNLKCFAFFLHIQHAHWNPITGHSSFISHSRYSTPIIRQQLDHFRYLSNRILDRTMNLKMYSIA